MIAPGPVWRCSSRVTPHHSLDTQRPHLQLLESLAREKAPAGCLEQDDALRHQLLPLLLQPGHHARLEEDLEERLQVAFRKCIRLSPVGGAAAQPHFSLRPPKMFVSSCPGPGSGQSTLSPEASSPFSRPPGPASMAHTPECGHCHQPGAYWLPASLAPPQTC